MNAQTILMTMPLIPVIFVFFLWLRDEHKKDKARMRRHDKEFKEVLKQTGAK